jgi:hypothetical protein
LRQMSVPGGAERLKGSTVVVVVLDMAAMAVDRKRGSALNFI